MRLHEALYWLHNGRGTPAQEAAIATLDAQLRKYAGPKAMSDLGVEDAVQLALIKLNRVRPVCAAALLEGEAAELADRQTASYCKRVVTSVVVDHVRRAQPRVAANSESIEARSDLTASGGDSEQLAASAEERHLLKTKIAVQVAVRRDPIHRERMRVEIARDVDQMFRLACGEASVADIVGVPQADPGFRTARDAMYQRHARTRQRLAVAVAELARMQRHVGGPAVVDAYTAECLLTLLKQLKRRRTDGATAAVRSSQSTASTDKLRVAAQPTPDYPKKDTMASHAADDHIVATDRIAPPPPDALPQGFAASATTASLEASVAALLDAVTRASEARTTEQMTALAKTRLLAAPGAQAQGWGLRSLHSAYQSAYQSAHQSGQQNGRLSVVLYRLDGGLLQDPRTPEQAAVGARLLALGPEPGVQEVWTVAHPQQGLRLTVQADGAIQVDCLQRKASPWAPPTLPVVPAPPVLAWVGEDAWLAQKLGRPDASDPLAVLTAAGQSARLSCGVAVTGQSLADQLGLELPQVVWVQSLSTAVCARAAKLLCISAEQLRDALLNLLDDDTLPHEQEQAARTACLRWRDNLQAVNWLLRCRTPEPSAADDLANVRDALADVDQILEPLCAVWDEHDVQADEHLQRAASADPDAWWARTGDPLWTAFADLDGDED